MAVNSIVPNIATPEMAGAKAFYGDILGTTVFGLTECASHLANADYTSVKT